jgi:hypothetical protein
MIFVMLSEYRQEGISPLFVFPGLNLARKERASTWDPRVEKHARYVSWIFPSVKGNGD